MKLFLSSKSLINEEITTHFLDFVAGNRNAAIITTAAQKYKERNHNIIQLREKLIQLGFQVQYIDIEFESPKQLLDFDVVIISGGNPYYLLYHLKKNKVDEVLNKIIERDIPVMGISAGGLVLTQDLAIIDRLTPAMNAEVKLLDKSGLGFIAEVIVPHYDRFVAAEIIDANVVDEFAAQTGREVIRLGEYQCIIYGGETRQIIGE
ncbi:MAG: Type 1 glutamine amidotransferase-like domain-containing protein [Saprospiraceae bacterium]